MQWYYAVGDQRVGPVSDAQFADLVRDGTIRPETLVWRQGMTAWQAYSVVNPASAVPEAGAATGEGTEVCAVSGKRYPRREMIQYEGKWVAAEHRDVFFQRLREGVAQPGHFVYGGFWMRFIAKIIDGIILYIVSLPLNMALGLLLLGSINIWGRATQVRGMERGLMFTGLSTLLGVVIAIAYAWFFISRYDATPGKMALGLKVVRADGSKLSTGRIVGRYFSEWVSGMILAIGYIMAAFDDEKRALHDRICDTRVIKAK